MAVIVETVARDAASTISEDLSAAIVCVRWKDSMIR